MSRSSCLCVLLMLSLASVGAGCASESCETSHPDLCGGGGAGGSGPGSGSILGVSPASYAEMNEATNVDTPEGTSYVLEDANGLEIAGTFESGAPTGDVYIFNSGTFGGVGEPDFPGADVRVFVDGEEVDGPGQGIGLGLDTVQYMGYSGLTGDYFINAALFADEDYELRITPNAGLAGKPYTIEIRGHVEEL